MSLALNLDQQLQEKIVKAQTNLEHCRREMAELKKSIVEVIPVSVSDDQVKNFVG